MTCQEAVVEMVSVLKTMQDRLEAIDKRLMVLEEDVSGTASADDLSALNDTFRYFGELLEQDKRERDLESIRADMRAASYETLHAINSRAALIEKGEAAPVNARIVPDRIAPNSVEQGRYS